MLIVVVIAASCRSAPTEPTPVPILPMSNPTEGTIFTQERRISHEPAQDYWDIEPADKLVARNELASISIHQILISRQFISLFYSVEKASPEVWVSAALSSVTTLGTNDPAIYHVAKEVRTVADYEGTSLGIITFHGCRPEMGAVTLRIPALEVQAFSFGPIETVEATWDIPLLGWLDPDKDLEGTWVIDGRDASDTGVVTRGRTFPGLYEGDFLVAMQTYLIGHKELEIIVDGRGSHQLLTSTRAPKPLEEPESIQPGD